MSGAFDDLLGSLSAAPVGGEPLAGWFGKLPLLGDFAHRRLPQAFVDGLDAWLSAGMEASRTQLGEAWLDTYLTGPLWRFALAPGVLDPQQWWFGVMMPSVDKVGRYFPLVVARGTAFAPEAAPAVDALEAWFAHIGGAVLGTLQPHATLDSFEQALAAAPVWVETLPERRPQAAHLPGRDRYTLNGSALLAQWAAGLGLREAMQFCAGRSLWWPDHASADDTSLSVANGLPDPGHFALLLRGEW